MHAEQRTPFGLLGDHQCQVMYYSQIIISMLVFFLYPQVAIPQIVYDFSLVLAFSSLMTCAGLLCGYGLDRLR